MSKYRVRHRKAATVMEELIARAASEEMLHPARMRHHEKLYGHYGKVGERILNLSEEDRTLLQDMKAEDIDVRIDAAYWQNPGAWYGGMLPDTYGFRSRYHRGLEEVYTDARKQYEESQKNKKYAKA